VNRARENDERNIAGLAQDKGIKIAGFIREDIALIKADGEGESIFSMHKESSVISDAYSIFAKTLKG
jgi:CO dehydrogenase nickel-insertion accessory protein CooC1